MHRQSVEGGCALALAACGYVFFTQCGQCLKPAWLQFGPTLPDELSSGDCCVELASRRGWGHLAVSVEATLAWSALNLLVSPEGPPSHTFAFATWREVMSIGNNSKTFVCPSQRSPLSTFPLESLLMGPNALICLFSIFISLILLSICIAPRKVSNANFHCILSPRCRASLKRQRKDFPGPFCRSPAPHQSPRSLPSGPPLWGECP